VSERVARALAALGDPLLLHVGGIASGGCTNRLRPEIVAACGAPFPNESFKEDARVVPALIPTSRDDPRRRERGGVESARTLDQALPLLLLRR
jgi:hypothetical protein